MKHSLAIFTAVHSATISASGDIELPHPSLLQLALRDDSQKGKSTMMTSTATLKWAGTEKKHPHNGTADVMTHEEFTGKYDEIFPHGNRNAASHRWFTYLYNQAEAGQTFDPDFAGMNKFYCPISGSPTSGADIAYITLPSVSGGTEEGAFSFCCSPCYCDMVDLVHVDTISVQGTQYRALVIGDPCTDSSIVNGDGTLNVAIVQDPSDPSSKENLAMVAPDVTCEESSGGGYKLQNATLSDGGYIIIGLLLDTTGLSNVQNFEDDNDCAERAKNGYVGGMGSIFRKVAEINPITSR
jgi:hypothetical protein